MPAEVETMMSADRKIPWHGLGTIVDEAPNGAEAMILAGLDWKVEKVPTFATVGGKKTETGYFVNVRDSDSRIVGNVGPDYEVIQNETMFEFADALLDTGDVKFETAGSLRQGALVWALAKIDRPVVVGGDETMPYLLVSNGHNGWQAFRAANTPVRVVCANTLQIALSGAKQAWTIRHEGDPLTKIAEAKQTLEVAYQYYDEFEKDVQELVDTEVTRHRFNSIVSRLIPKGETDRQENARSEQRDQIGAVYEGATVQPFTGTGWGLVNAVSEWELWGRPHRSKRDPLEVQADKLLFNKATPMTSRAHKMLVAAN